MPSIDPLDRFATQSVATPHGSVQYREARSPGAAGRVTHVLLHGIGSASGSWLAQLEAARQRNDAALRVLAWDAPGYGASDALTVEQPRAADYATRVWAWLDALGVGASDPVTLVGHSLGALMAAAATLQAPQRVAALVLLAPAQGYGNADPAVRQKKLADRLDSLARLGPAGLARQRGAALLSPGADAAQRALVERLMAAIDPHGYTQAAHMLAQGDLAADLGRVACPVTVASGSADTITPPEACAALARQLGTPYLSLGPVGHACAIEAPIAVNRLLGLQAEQP